MIVNEKMGFDGKVTRKEEEKEQKGQCEGEKSGSGAAI